MKTLKSIIIFLFVFMLITPVFATTNANFESWVYTSSNNLFSDELDWGFNLYSNLYSGNFYILDKKYIVIGYLNNSTLDIDSSSSFNPFYFGIYFPGTKPKSVYFSFDSDILNSNPDGSADYSEAYSSVTSGSTTYYYVATSTDIKYDYANALENSFSAQLLFGMKNLIAGLYINFKILPDISEDFSGISNIVASLPGMGSYDYWLSNATKTENIYYNSAASGQPVQTLDYSLQTQAKMPNTDIIFQLNLPVLFNLEKLSLYAQLSYKLDYTDYSSTFIREITNNPYSSFSEYNVNSQVEKFKTINSIGIDSVLSLPDLFKLNKQNKFNLGLSASLDINNMTVNSDIVTIKTYNYPGNNAEGTLTANTKYVKTYEFANSLNYDISVFSQYLFYFTQVKNFKFSFGPKILFEILKEYTDPFALLSDTTITYNDNDNNGDYTSTGDTSTKVVRVYNGAGVNSNFYFYSGLSIPSAISFRPFNSSVELIIGNNIETTMVYKVTNSPDNTTIYNSDSITYDNNGNITSETYEDRPDVKTETDTSITWNFSNSFSYVLVFHIDDNTKFNFKISGNNFWDITSYQVQFIWGF